MSWAEERAEEGDEGRAEEGDGVRYVRWKRGGGKMGWRRGG